MNKAPGALISGIFASLSVSAGHTADSFENTIESFLDDYPWQLIHDFMHQRTAAQGQ